MVSCLFWNAQVNITPFHTCDQAITIKVKRILQLQIFLASVLLCMPNAVKLTEEASGIIFCKSLLLIPCLGFLGAISTLSLNCVRGQVVAQLIYMPWVSFTLLCSKLAFVIQVFQVISSPGVTTSRALLEYGADWTGS